MTDGSHAELLATHAVGPVGQFREAIFLTLVRLVHQEYPEDRKADFDQTLQEPDDPSERARKHCDKDAQNDVQHDEGNRKDNRLPCVEAHEFVLIVGFQVEKDHPGYEAQQIGQSCDQPALRPSGLSVHLAILLAAPATSRMPPLRSIKQKAGMTATASA